MSSSDTNRAHSSQSGTCQPGFTNSTEQKEKETAECRTFSGSWLIFLFFFLTILGTQRFKEDTIFKLTFSVFSGRNSGGGQGFPGE